MSVYYNDNAPHAIKYLKHHISKCLIADGDIDERSIEDVTPRDLEGYTQHHFFAGIGGWSHALRLAGWPDSKAVWTISCPCQPFSQAGKGLGFNDERHLWPAVYWLISQYKPSVIFGEQSASPAARSWLDLVSTDMEALDFAIAAADLCAASVGAPQIRQRIFWLANAHRDGRYKTGNSQSEKRYDGLERDNRSSQGRGNSDTYNNFWGDIDWLGCRDGRFRPIEPGTFPMANGVSQRVSKLRGIGNSIVPQLASAFIQAASRCESNTLVC